MEKNSLLFFSEKSSFLGAGPKSSLIILWKSVYISETYIYSERGVFGASFYGKKSITFFPKNRIFKGGGVSLRSEPFRTETDEKPESAVNL